MASIKGPIKTIVVLVMENRSFDHMLGWFNRINPEIDGLQATYCNPLNTSDPNSEQVYVSDAAEYVDPDPGHSFQAIRQQIFGRDDDTSADPPPMNGFAQQAESEQKGLSKRVMSAFKPEALPSYKKLVEEFAVCDRWFCSIPTSTQPNRMYVQSATSHGAISNRRSDLLKGFPQKTIFESVYEAGLSIGIYYQDIPAVLFLKNLRKLKYLVHFHDYDLSFKKHASLGKLPNYSVVEQRYFNHSIFPASDDHPPHDVRQGQKLIKDVYDTLRASPQWNEILFVITYDEHGGYYDHVPTPIRNVPNPDGLDAQTDPPFKFDRLGVRVPAIFVSPWIEKGTVLHKPEGPTPDSQYEHSSIPATVRTLFNLKAPLTKRDEWAGTFDNVINRTSPRTDCPVTLPNLDDELKVIGENNLLSSFQKELVLLASLLEGDESNPDVGNEMTVKDAKKYIDSTIKEFIESGCHAFKTRKCNHDHIWKLPRKTCFNSCCFI